MDALTATMGLKDFLDSNKEIYTDNINWQKQPNMVKLKFTPKQFQAFRDACHVFDLLSSDPRFTDFVRSVFGDVKVPTISKQLVQPIVDAPTKIPLKLPRRANSTRSTESHFTAPKQATDACRELYSAINDPSGIKFKHDISSGITCVTDVRMMLTKYISENNLKTELGTVLDDFIMGLAAGALHKHRQSIPVVNGTYIIPTGNRKIMSDIIQEVTLGRRDEDNEA